MNIDGKPTNVPLGATVTLTMNAEDLDITFMRQADPDENLFFRLFSPVWDELSVSEKLQALAQAASLAETRADKLGLTAGYPEPK